MDEELGRPVLRADGPVRESRALLNQVHTIMKEERVEGSLIVFLWKRTC
jgi:hypothetical protein